MTIHIILNRTFLALAVGSLIVANGLPAGAAMTKDGGKNAAWTSVSGVVLPLPFTTVGTVTIAKGKKKRVLEVDAVLTETSNNATTALGLRATVNGLSLEPTGAYQVKEGCSLANPNCTVIGRWWIDLDQAELLLPGGIIGQPLTINVQDAIAGSTGTGNIAVRARLVAP